MKWTETEEGRLAQLYPGTRNKEIAALLNRSVAAIEVKAKKMGLSKNTNTGKQDDAVMSLWRLALCTPWGST